MKPIPSSLSPRSLTYPPTSLLPRLPVLHLLVALLCFGALGVAYYLQAVAGMAPCPLCIVQRYVFAVIGLVSLGSLFGSTGLQRRGVLAAGLLSLGGLALAGWLLWVRAHPSVACGIDQLQVALNRLPTAEALPGLFRAEGLCSSAWPPVLGVSVPAWSFLLFAGLLGTLLMTLRAGKRASGR